MKKLIAKLPLFDPLFGKESPLTWRDVQALRRQSFLSLEDAAGRRFKNVIIDHPFCRTPFGRREFFLVNTDPEHDYRVTLRLHWEWGIHEGEAYVNVVAGAGSKISLGCEAANTFPVLVRKWEVVGETVISQCWI